MKMKEKEAEIEKAFYGIPELQRLFKQYERELRYYSRYRWNKYTTKEKLAEKRDVFWKLVREMDNFDLLILYYAHNIESLGKYRTLRLLRDLYRAQCNFKNKLYGTEEYIDIVEVGSVEYGRKEENDENFQKNP